ncbi:MAG TPA: single-stranded DNA-binding protein [Candidatus Dormibacteraeota bacterium]|jgi:single-strand DNA-binding protein|nr:single-stranded DNA-binding protein [Candidatus Dormibacteraeota bacterium]
MVNRVFLIGNLTRDAETIAAKSPMTRMRLATNSMSRDSDGNLKEYSEFHTVIAFGRLAEICAAYCVKGRRIAVEGKLRTRDYEDSNGVRKYVTEVVADSMKLLDRPDGARERDVDAGAGDTSTFHPSLATAG